MSGIDTESTLANNPMSLSYALLVMAESCIRESMREASSSHARDVTADIESLQHGRWITTRVSKVDDTSGAYTIRCSHRVDGRGYNLDESKLQPCTFYRLLWKEGRPILSEASHSQMRAPEITTFEWDPEHEKIHNLELGAMWATLPKPEVEVSLSEVIGEGQTLPCDPSAHAPMLTSTQDTTEGAERELSPKTWLWAGTLNSCYRDVFRSHQHDARTVTFFSSSNEGREALARALTDFMVKMEAGESPERMKWAELEKWDENDWKQFLESQRKKKEAR